MQIAALNKPNFKTLTGLLISGLLVKIALSTAFLAPAHGLFLNGPRSSEAATGAAVASPEPAQNLPRLMALLDKERHDLMTREAATTAREEQLGQIKHEVEERLKNLQTLQQQLMETIEEDKRIKGEHNRHLVATLQAMSPDRAGKLLEQMDEEEAVRLLRRLSGKEAGAILSLLSPDKAARLSHRFLQ